MEPTSCRICSDEDIISNLISPCKCKGSSKYVHRECLDLWRNRDGVNSKNFNQCYICNFKYGIEKQNKNEIELRKQNEYNKKIYSEYILLFIIALSLVIIILFLPKYITIYLPLLFIYLLLIYVLIYDDIMNTNYLYFDYIVLVMYVILILSIDKNYYQSNLLIFTTCCLTLILFYFIYCNYITKKENYYKNKIWKNIAYNHKVVDYGINGPI